ncbi:MAG: helix-turn-helix transcriptional regulator [Balneola sp.]
MQNKKKLEQAFGEVLRKLRVEQNLSQDKLAELSHLDRTYISLLERGLRTPTISTLFSISYALDNSPSRIIKLVEKRINENN